MKKKNLILIILVITILVIGAVIWFWQTNFKATDASLANVKKRGVLVVGSDIPYGVMEFFDENYKEVGIDVDIAQEIANKLGVKLEFNDYDWESIFSKVEKGDIDLAISSITITPERQKIMLFSNPYFNGGQIVIVRSDNTEIKGMNDLFNKKIAVQKDTTGYIEAKKYTKENLIFPYLNFETSLDGSNIVNDLKDGKFDAIIVDYVQGLSIIKSNKEVTIVGVPFTKENYGIATKLGNNSLMDKVNSILSNMEKSGVLQKIKIKWTIL